MAMSSVCWPRDSATRSRLATARVQAKPASQVLDLAIHGGGHGLVEGHVLVDRVDPEHAGLAVGGGVQLSDQPVAVEDRQREVPPAALGGRLVHLQLVVELEQLDRPLAV